MPFDSQILQSEEKILWPPQEIMPNSPLILTNKRIFTHISCRVKLHFLNQLGEKASVRCNLDSDKQPPFKLHNREIFQQQLPAEVGSSIGDYIAWNLSSLTDIFISLGIKGRFCIIMDYGKDRKFTLYLQALSFQQYKDITNALQVPFSAQFGQVQNQLQGQPFLMAGQVRSVLDEKIKRGEDSMHFDLRCLLVMASVFGLLVVIPAVFGLLFGEISFQMYPTTLQWILLAFFIECLVMISWALLAPRKWFQKMIETNRVEKVIFIKMYLTQFLLCFGLMGLIVAWGLIFGSIK